MLFGDAAQSMGPQALGEGGHGGHQPAASGGVCLRPEAGRTHTESIFLMPSISFMRMDYTTGVIYTNGDDKF